MVTVSKSPVRYPPGPKGHFILGVVPDFSRNPLSFLSRCAQEYGDIVYLRNPLFPLYQLNHPDYIEKVRGTGNNQFVKFQTKRMLKQLIGNGLLTSEGDFWHNQRRLMQPAFHRERIAAYGEVIVTYTNRLLKTWQDGEIRDVHQDMMNLTIGIAANTLFHADVAGQEKEIVDAITVTLEYVEARGLKNPLSLLISDWIPTSNKLRFQAAVRQLDNIIYRIIQQRRTSGEDKGDLLSMLLHAQDEDGTRMTDQQLRDEVMTLLLASYEASAAALSWTWYLLSQHSEVESKLMAELQSVLNGRTPNVEDFSRLRYTEMVLMESLRLYPPAWIATRKAIGDCEVAGYPVRAGDVFIMSQWVMHRDPRYFDLPDVFNPERWAGDLAKRLPAFAYFPFGGGPRICLGKAFATMETVLVIATIAQKFQLKLVTDHPVIPWSTFHILPKYGIKMQLTQRSSIQQ